MFQTEENIINIEAVWKDNFYNAQHYTGAVLADSLQLPDEWSFLTIRNKLVVIKCELYISIQCALPVTTIIIAARELGHTMCIRNYCEFLVFSI